MTRQLPPAYFLRFAKRFGEITQKPNPPFITAYAGQGDLVRSAESFSQMAGTTPPPAGVSPFATG